MTVNPIKSNVIHFRPKAVQRTSDAFKCGNNVLNIVDRYTYLGVILHEHLDYSVTVKAVNQSASRALGLLIAKCKGLGGVPF
jgi:hypothetical protein